MKKYIIRFYIEGGMGVPGGDVEMEIRADHIHVAREFATALGDQLKYGGVLTVKEQPDSLGNVG